MLARKAAPSARSGVMSLKTMPFLGKSGMSRTKARRSTAAAATRLDHSAALGDAPQPGQAALFELPHALAGEAELLSHLFQRHALAAAEAETHFQNLALAVAHLVQGLAQLVVHAEHREDFVRPLLLAI